MPIGTVTAKPFEGLIQTGYQIFSDTGGPTNVNNATALAAPSSGANVLAGGTARIRMRVELGLAGYTNYRYLLEYSRNGGTWTSVDAAAEVRIAASANFVDGSATIQRLGSLPFVAGEGVQTVRDSAAITLSSGGAVTATEIEWCVNFFTATVGDTFRFRVVVLGIAWTGGAYSAQTLDGYNVYGNISIGVAIATPANANVFQGSYLGMEVTPGLAVAATKHLLGTSFDIGPKFNIKSFTPAGSKFATATYQGKEFADGKINGKLNFNDMLYLLSTVMCLASITTPQTNGVFAVNLGAASAGTFTLTFNGQTTIAIAFNATAGVVLSALQNLSTIGPYAVSVSGSAGSYAVVFGNGLSYTNLMLTGVGTGLTGGALTITTTAATNTRRWTFTPNNTQPDPFMTYTLEHGSKLIASQSANLNISQMDIKINKDECAVSGAFFATKLVEPFSLSAGVVDVPMVICNPKDWAVYLGDSPTLMQYITECLVAEWNLGNRQSPVMFLNKDPSFSVTVEDAVAATNKLTVGHDSNGIAILNKVRASALQFLKYENIGPQIELGYNYRMALTSPIRYVNDPRAAANLFCSMPDAEMMYDSGFGSSLTVSIDTPLATL